MSATLPTIDDTPEASPGPNQGPVDAADDAGPDVAQGLVKTPDHLIIIIIILLVFYYYHFSFLKIVFYCYRALRPQEGRGEERRVSSEQRPQGARIELGPR